MKIDEKVLERFAVIIRGASARDCVSMHFNLCTDLFIDRWQDLTPILKDSWIVHAKLLIRLFPGIYTSSPYVERLAEEELQMEKAITCENCNKTIEGKKYKMIVEDEAIQLCLPCYNKMWAVSTCDHKFVDSKVCLKCGLGQPRSFSVTDDKE